jgi:hypothetical protein
MEPEYVVQNPDILNDDYQITEGVLRSDVSFLGTGPKLRISLTSISITTLLIFIFADADFLGSGLEKLGYAILVGAIVFVIGVIGGLFWQYMGLKVASATYMVYLEDHPAFGRYQKLFLSFYQRFAQKNTAIYLEGNAIDPKLTVFKNRFALIFRISLTQLSFFITSIAFLSRPVVAILRDWFSLGLFEDYETEFQVVFGLGFAVFLQALYLPGSYILEDSNVRTWLREDRKIGIPLAGLRGKINSIISIGAIATGWGLYQKLYEDDQFLFNDIYVTDNESILQLVNYLLWLGAILCLSWPLIIPSALTYFMRHEDRVNTFRKEAIRCGIPVGVSLVRDPSTDEVGIINNFAQNEQVV